MQDAPGSFHVEIRLDAEASPAIRDFDVYRDGRIYALMDSPSEPEVREFDSAEDSTRSLRISSDADYQAIALMNVEPSSDEVAPGYKTFAVPPKPGVMLLRKDRVDAAFPDRESRGPDTDMEVHKYADLVPLSDAFLGFGGWAFDGDGKPNLIVQTSNGDHIQSIDGYTRYAYDLERGSLIDVVIGDITFTHTNDLALVDLVRNKVILVADGSDSVKDLYQSDQEELLGDVASDVFGNVYFVEGESVKRVDRFGNIETIWRSTNTSGVMIGRPSQIVMSSGGDLFLLSEDGLSVGRVSNVAATWDVGVKAVNLASSATDNGKTLAVEMFCNCGSGYSPPGTSYMKVKLSASAVSGEGGRIASDRVRLLFLLEGSPNVSSVVLTSDAASRVDHEEAISDRVLFEGVSRQELLTPIKAVEVNGASYSLYSVPANATDSVYIPGGEGMGFASELPAIPILPGMRYFDSRRSYGSAVFYLPNQNSKGERVLPIPIGVSWEEDDGTWVAVAGTTKWGRSAEPWSF